MGKINLTKQYSAIQQLIQSAQRGNMAYVRNDSQTKPTNKFALAAESGKMDLITSSKTNVEFQELKNVVQYHKIWFRNTFVAGCLKVDPQ